jgi:hypothetical protein
MMSQRFEQGAVASRKLSSRSEGIPGYNAGSLADDDLIARCHSFENGLRQWSDFVHQTGICGYDENDLGLQAAALRASWDNDLIIIKSYSPESLAAAIAKVSAAETLVALTSALDADATAFLASAIRELQHLDRSLSREASQRGRGITAQRSPRLFDFLARRF